jgi:hypothetical protein
MNIKGSLKKYSKSFEEITTQFAIDYNSIHNNQKEWLSNLEDKIHLLKNISKELAIKRVLQKLKSEDDFVKNDTLDISIFISNINTIILIANRINNYKDGTLLDDGSKLEVYKLFNSIKKANKISELKVTLNQNLNSYIPHLFSIIKHSQNPLVYPIHYKFWKNILREVLDLKDDYDNFCEFYRTFPHENRHLVFGSYLGTIGLQIGKNIKNDYPQLQLDSKEYKFLIDNVINIEPYSTALNESFSIQNEKNSINTNYWIFQGNPKKYNAVAAINADAVKSWTVSAHRDKIKKGDKFILWLTGADDGCYALGTVASEVTQMKEEDIEMGYYTIPEDSIEAYRVKIVIDHNLTDTPILRDMITEDAVFKDFKGGNQGTNFTATKAQYEAMLGFVNANSSNAYTNVKKVLHQRKLQSFLALLRNYLKEHNIQPNDSRISFNVWEKENRLVFLIGRRYVLNIQKKGTETEFSFTTKNILTEKNGGFTNQKGEIEAYWNVANSIENYVSEIEEGFTIELARNTKCPYRKYTNQDFINEVYQIKQSAMEKALSESKFPLNQILYGPPGTGKTYNTVLEAAKIITGNELIAYEEALRVFKANLDHQIEFITFHQNYSYEDFIQGLRPDTENGSALTFEKKDGVFKRIADRAYKNLMASENPANAKKEFDVVFGELIQPLNDGEVTEVEIKMRKSSFFITAVGEKSIDFRKNIDDSEHTLSINTLRKMYDKGLNDIILGGLQPYYNPILELLLEKGRSEVTPTQRKNYVIIIDEINRANISRVFGELITLIEEDKRSHGSIPMRVTLPSGDSFIVPSNLYIIGTMNTADKSIALLDIALRRRFEFVPKYPLYVGLAQTVNDADKLRKINEAIVSRKNHDFTIGHAYFMGDDYSLEKTINHKVIPLLLEYFMNSEKEVIDILKEAGITIGGWPLRMIS